MYIYICISFYVYQEERGHKTHAISKFLLVFCLIGLFIFKSISIYAWERTQKPGGVPQSLAGV